jgi:hypothetical protein
MEEFYIDVQLNRGLVRLQVDEVPPEEWDVPYAPQFIVEFHNGAAFITLTLRLEHGQWYDSNSRYNSEEQHPHYLDADDWNPYYQGPLDHEEINEVGRAIARHMIVHLQAYMGLFIPAFPDPAVN